ncbi:hypothetical protein RchiOBHm_Chr3g0470761 [Rosa chinensis]|uniref:Uncharacterized protein n=1 Tax=Rosa chinensis TaxID=74649 RepID=A0A2P6RB44_ROSCH|nr:hypothetical protein RchiOBHm_Chr3g0470761 [Rosa chinensis]
MGGDNHTGVNSFCENKALQLFNLFFSVLVPGVMDIPLPLSKLAMHLVNHDDNCLSLIWYYITAIWFCLVLLE